MNPRAAYGAREGQAVPPITAFRALCHRSLGEKAPSCAVLVVELLRLCETCLERLRGMHAAWSFSVIASSRASAPNDRLQHPACHGLRSSFERRVRGTVDSSVRARRSIEFLFFEPSSNFLSLDSP